MGNFSFLEKQFPLLAELGEKAEQYLYTDPNTTMFKLRSLGEKIVELMFQYDKEMDPTDHTQVARIRWLSQEDYLPWQEADSLTILRKLGNKAVHDDYASLEDAKLCLKVAYSLCQWFMVTYGDYPLSGAAFCDAFRNGSCSGNPGQAGCGAYGIDSGRRETFPCCQRESKKCA